MRRILMLNLNTAVKEDMELEKVKMKSIQPSRRPKQKREVCSFHLSFPMENSFISFQPASKNTKN